METHFCMEDKDVYLQGTRDSATNEQEHAYVVYEVLVCTEDTRDPDLDPECETDREKIEEWFSEKLIQVKVIDYKIDFKNRESFAVR